MKNIKKNKKELENMYNYFSKTSELSLKYLGFNSIKEYKKQKGKYDINPSIGAMLNELDNPELEKAEFKHSVKIKLDSKRFFDEFDKVIEKFNKIGFNNRNSYSKWRVFFILYTDDKLEIKGKNKTKLNKIVNILNKLYKCID